MFSITFKFLKVLDVQASVSRFSSTLIKPSKWSMSSTEVLRVGRANTRDHVLYNLCDINDLDISDFGGLNELVFDFGVRELLL